MSPSYLVSAGHHDIFLSPEHPLQPRILVLLSYHCMAASKALYSQALPLSTKRWFIFIIIKCSLLPPPFFLGIQLIFIYQGHHTSLMHVFLSKDTPAFYSVSGRSFPCWPLSLYFPCPCMQPQHSTIVIRLRLHCHSRSAFVEYTY